jgi:hypothetical protein
MAATPRRRSRGDAANVANAKAVKLHWPKGNGSTVN